MELNWENTEAWQEKANEGRKDGLAWRWDCNFKLDFDGALLGISSRFYPPHYNSGDFWEGKVHIYFLDSDIYTKDFKCDTLDELKTEVEKFTKYYTDAVKAVLPTIIP